MPSATIRLTVGHALARFLVAQRVVIDGRDEPFFPGVFAIFGHGNALGLGDGLAGLRDRIPTYRGQNEQGMALAAVGYAKAARRRQCMVVTTSIGPGALNVVTAAGVAMANRLPLLVLAGDTFVSRAPDPVLQQVEHPGAPGTTANDAFRAVTRYWDRITSPAQLAQTLPQVVSLLLDPADCGPVLLALPQDVQAQAYDFPAALFRPVMHRVPRPRADVDTLAAAAEALRAARRPLVVAGGGVHYSLAETELSAFAARHGVPVVETVAGKSSLVADDPAYAGPVGVLGAPSANVLAAQADVVLAVGTRLQDFTTASWTAFQDPALTVIGVNAARFDAVKHRSLPVVGDARESLVDLGRLLAGWSAPPEWTERGRAAAGQLRAAVEQRTSGPPVAGLPTYAQVVGAVHRAATADDYVLTASGGLPGELDANWLSKGVASFDCEYGFSCMGYEMAGAWGAAMQLATRSGDGTVLAMTGDGSYLMLNSELYSAVLNGDHLVLVVCDNGGYAVIERLQLGHGAESFRTMLAEPDRPDPPRVDFVAHAAALGCRAVRATTTTQVTAAVERARREPGVHVIVVDTHPSTWTDSGAFWEVGVPEVSDSEAVRAARAELEHGKSRQRSVW